MILDIELASSKVIRNPPTNITKREMAMDKPFGTPFLFSQSGNGVIHIVSRNASRIWLIRPAPA